MPKINYLLSIVLIGVTLIFTGCSVIDSGFEAKKLPMVWGEDDFKWGVHFSNYPLNLLNEGLRPDRIEKEMQLVKQLGATHIRFNLEFIDNLDIDPPITAIFDEVNDTVVNLAYKYQLSPVMVLEPGHTFYQGDLDHSYELAYERAYRTATRYKNKVKYYQMADEITGVILQQAGDDSEVLPDPYGYNFNKTKYEREKAWLRGFYDGIKKADPDAKTIITGHWAWHKIIDYLVNDGVPFDIIGWAWYSPDGLDFNNLKITNIGKEYNIHLLDELAKFGKEIWIIESNRDKGSYDPEGKGEEKQAEFISMIIKNVYESGKVSGYFIFPFLDTPPEVNSTPMGNNWGIVRIKKDSQGVYQFGEPKKAYWVYRDFIVQHP